MKSNHPIDEFEFSIADGKLPEPLVAAFRLLSESLATARAWTIHPPRFEFDPAQPGDEEEPFDVAIRLSVYTAMPRWLAELPPEVNRAQFEEVKAVIDALTAFSKEHNLRVDVGFRRESIGSISRGNVGRTLQIGLIDEWEKMLKLREGTTNP